MLTCVGFFASYFNNGMSGNLVVKPTKASEGNEYWYLPPAGEPKKVTVKTVTAKGKSRQVTLQDDSILQLTKGGICLRLFPLDKKPYYYGETIYWFLRKTGECVEGTIDRPPAPKGGRDPSDTSMNGATSSFQGQPYIVIRRDVPGKPNSKRVARVHVRRCKLFRERPSGFSYWYNRLCN